MDMVIGVQNQAIVVDPSPIKFIFNGTWKLT